MASAKEQKRRQLKDLITLVAAGANGKRISVSVNDWESMMRLASEHNVLPLFACALLSSPNLDCPESIQKIALDVMRHSSATNTIRRQRVFYLLRELISAGFDVKLLKGYAVARYYSFPESRDSADTDIWVREDQERAIYAFFTEKGFQVEERSLTSHHGICQHKRFGKIEVHTKLYDEIVENVWFKVIDINCFLQDNFEKVSTPEGDFITLGVTDQLIFLSLHMIKHFIDGGISIRMMLDIALHFVKYREEIEQARYWGVMRELHYADVLIAVLGIMVQYGGFDELAQAMPEMPSMDKINMMIDDLVAGGYMGVKEYAVRLESAMEYNRQLLLKEKNQLQYCGYMLWWKIRSAYKFMFPNAKYLRQKYRFLERLPLLLPFVWIYQMLAFPIEKIRSGALKRDIRLAEKNMSEEVTLRVDLFKKLGMF